MKKNISLLMLLITILFLPHFSQAAELITNGGFETGNFTGWTATNASGYWRPWSVTGSGAGGGPEFSQGPQPTSVQQGSFVAWHGVTASANQSFTLVQQITLPAATNVRLTWRDKYQMNYTEFCSSGCGTATYAVEILNTSNTLLQTLYTVTTPTNTNTNTGWVNHAASLTPYAGQSIRIRFRTTVTQSLQGPGQLEIDAVSAQTLLPTAAMTSLSGRVTTAEGAGIRNVSVSLTDLNGVRRSALTGPFGYYSFDEVEVGKTYIVGISAKRFSFSQPSQVITVTEEAGEVNFSAESISDAFRIKTTENTLNY